MFDERNHHILSLQTYTKENDDNSLTEVKPFLQSGQILLYVAVLKFIIYRVTCHSNGNTDVHSILLKCFQDFHEVNVLHEFCQKQKKTIRNLQREIEQLRVI